MSFGSLSKYSFLFRQQANEKHIVIHCNNCHRSNGFLVFIQGGRLDIVSPTKDLTSYANPRYITPVRADIQPRRHFPSVLRRSTARGALMHVRLRVCVRGVAYVRAQQQRGK